MSYYYSFKRLVVILVGCIYFPALTLGCDFMKILLKSVTFKKLKTKDKRSC